MPAKIGAVMALDGEREFTQGIKRAQNAIKNLDAETKKYNEETEDSANTLETLTEKHDLLAKAVELHKNKEEAIKKALNNAKSTYKKMGDNLDDLKTQYKEASTKLEDYKKANGDSSKEVKDQEKVVKDLADAIKKQETAYNSTENKISKYEAALTKAETETIKANKALDKNDEYLDEAKASADGLAKSLDKVSDEEDDLADNTDSMGDRLKTGFAIKAMDMMGDAVASMGRKLVDAGKYVINVGSTFESSMSKVKALSGASTTELGKLEDMAKQLGSSTQFSASEVADAFSYMSLAGWDTEEMLSGISGVLDLAASSGMDLAQASDMVTDYLSAFGLEAKDATRVADMLAFAQANSNTSAEQLGEAYSNSAANLNASGQSIETTTALLEAMANQGTKGSEAGTALSAIMSQITQKMEDGAIAIGDYNVAVQDENGNFRSLVDIVGDIADVTDDMGEAERAAALASTFNRTALSGLNLILNEGVDNVEDYYNALLDCDGAASDMAGTMNDNLNGSLTALGSATEGLGIALYDYFGDGLKGAVDWAAGAISGLTDLITPNLDTFEQFNEEIKASIEGAQDSLQNSQDVAAQGEADAAKMKIYKEALTELNEKIKSGKYSEDELYYARWRVKQIVDELGESVPELKDAYNEETGAIDLSTEAIEGLITAQEKLILQNALAQAASDATTSWASAELAAKMASNNIDSFLEAHDGYASRLKRYAEANGYALETHEDWIRVAKLEDNTNWTETGRVLDETADEFLELAKAESEATEVRDEAAKKMDEIRDLAESVAEEYKNDSEQAAKLKVRTEQYAEVLQDGTIVWHDINLEAKSYGQTVDDVSEKMAAMKDAIDEADLSTFGEDAENVSEQFEGLAETLANGSYDDYLDFSNSLSNLEELTAAYTNLYTSIDNALASKIKLDEAWVIEDPDENDNIETYIANLDATTASTETFKDNIDTINDYVDQYGGEGAQALLDSLIDAGPEAATEAGVIADSIKEAMGGRSADFDRLAESYARSISMKDQASQIAADATSTGKATVNAFGQFTSEFQTTGQNYILGAVQGMATERATAIAEATSIARSILNAISDTWQIHSPSRVAYAQGKFYVQGLTNGLVNTSGKAVSAAKALGSSVSNAISNKFNLKREDFKSNKEFYDAIFKEAEDYLRKKETTQNWSAAAEVAYWKQVLKTVKKYSDAYYQVLQRINDSENKSRQEQLRAAEDYIRRKKLKNGMSLTEEIKYWKDTLKTLKKGSDEYRQVQETIWSLQNDKRSVGHKEEVLNHTMTVGKQSLNYELNYWKDYLKTVKKGTDNYYEALANLKNAREQYVQNQMDLNGKSLQWAISYWKNYLKTLKKNSTEYLEVQATIRGLEQDVLSQRESAQDKLLSNWKVYNKTSLRAEMQYWDAARKQFEKGTQERIDADAKYQQAKQEYYDALYELDTNYRNDAKEVNDQLLKDVESQTEAYKDAVDNRKDAILSSFNLFESWDAEGYGAETLLENLRSQVTGLAFWEENLRKLTNRGVLSDNLIAELSEMGADGAANIYSLANATDELLAEYQRLYEERGKLAESQAVLDNKKLKDDTEAEIARLEEEAQQSLTDLWNTYMEAHREINTAISSTLTDYLSTAENATLDGIASLFKNANSIFVEQADDFSTNLTQRIYDALDTTEVKNQMAEAGSVMGQSILEGMLDTLVAESLINQAFGAVSENLSTAFTDLSGADFNAVNAITATSTYAAPVVNIDTSSMSTMLTVVVNAMQAAVEQMAGMTMVLDTGELVGSIMPSVSESLATMYIGA